MTLSRYVYVCLSVLQHGIMKPVCLLIKKLVLRYMCSNCVAKKRLDSNPVYDMTGVTVYDTVMLVATEI